MTPTRPYLIRAFYEWIVDNKCTPHLVVNTDNDYVEVPEDYIENDQIVLNISMSAVQSLALDNDAISFEARFNGIVHSIYVPVKAVMAIYAKENGRGMVFSQDDGELPPGDDDDSDGHQKGGTKGSGGKKSSGKPHLTIVK